MDFAKAFAFVFDDPDWVQKTVIGGLINLIPIIGQVIVLGYMIEVGRNVIRGNPRPLPDWSDIGRLAVDGLSAFVISIVYVLPILAILCLVLLSALAIGGAFDSDGAPVNAIVAVGIFCFSGFAVIYGIAVGWLFLPAALARYADTEDLMSALRFGEVWAITRANPVVFLMALLVSWAASFIGGFGIVVCVIGVWFTQFYAQCVTGHVYGQAYLVARQSGAGRTTGR